MMKDRLRFLLLLLIAASFLFSCASKSDEPADEQPVVEAALEEKPAVEVAVQEPAVPAEPVITLEPEEPVSENTEPDVPDAVSTEPDAEETMIEEEPTVVFEEEFIEADDDSEQLPSDEPVYIVDVSSYYDDFAISEDDFVAVEVPSSEPEQESLLQEEPVMMEEFVVAEEFVAVAEPEETDDTDVLEEAVPAMEPLYVPAPRENMKKPVSVISEEQAAAAVEQEKEVAVSELEEILAAIPEPEKPAGPVASRSVSIRKNDIIEVPYQGNWWVYLGDANSSGALTFTGRDYVAEKTVFTLRASKEGTALLHFFKQDIIANVMVDDYLEVIVEEAGGLSEKKTLDMFIISQIKPEPVDAEESGEGENAVSADAATATVSPAPDTANAPVIQSYQNANAPASSDVAPAANEDAPAPDENILLSDAELFAKAQALEATDIEGALALYKQLVANYPTSPYWTKANNRITYINRFYFFKR